MLGEIILHEKKSTEFVQSKKSGTSMWKRKIKKYFVEEIFWDSILSSSGNVSLNTYKRRKWVSIPSLERLLPARGESGYRIFGFGYFVGLCVSYLYAFYRDTLCKISFLEAAPSSKNIKFFPWEHNGTLYFCLGWKWKGMLPNVSNPQMSLVWKE